MMELELRLRSALHLLLWGTRPPWRFPGAPCPTSGFGAPGRFPSGLLATGSEKCCCDVFPGDLAFHKGVILRLQLPILCAEAFPIKASDHLPGAAGDIPSSDPDWWWLEGLLSSRIWQLLSWDRICSGDYANGAYPAGHYGGRAAGRLQRSGPRPGAKSLMRPALSTDPLICDARIIGASQGGCPVDVSRRVNRGTRQRPRSIRSARDANLSRPRLSPCVAKSL